MTDIAELALRVDSSQARTATRDLDKFGKEGRSAEGAATKLGKTSKAAFGAMALAATAAVGAVLSLGKAVSIIREFESSMSQVAAITRASTAELEALRDVAKNLGSTTEFSASQAADGLKFLGMAGFNAAESIAAIPAVLDLATVAALDLGTAADIASNIMSGFGIEAQEAARVADVLAATSTRANTSVTQLGGAMATVAPISAAMGISLEDTASAIGIMSDAGIQGERAGTALRGVLASLAGPTKQAKDVLAAYGLTAADVNPETVGLSKAMEALGMAGVSTADAMQIFGREAASGALVLIDAGNKIDTFSAAIEAASGAAADGAAIFRDNLGGDALAAASALAGLAIALGEAGLTAVLRTALKIVTGFTRGLTTLTEGVSGFFTAHDPVAQAVLNAATAMNQEAQQALQLSNRLLEMGEVSYDVLGSKIALVETTLRGIEANRQEAVSLAKTSEAYRDAANTAQQANDVIRTYQSLVSSGIELSPENLASYKDWIGKLQVAVATQQEIVDAAGGIGPEYDKAVAELDILKAYLADADGATVTLDDNTEDVSTNLNTASGAASGLANEMGRAASEAQAFVANLGRGSGIAGLRAEVSALSGGGSSQEVAGARREAEIRSSPEFQSAMQSTPGFRDAALDGLQKEIALEKERVGLMEQRSSLLTTINATGGGGGSGGGGGGAASSVTELTEAARAAQSILSQVNREATTYAQVVNELSAALNAGKISQDAFNAAVDLADEKFNEVDRAAQNFGDGLSTVFADALMGANSLSDGLGRLLTQLGNVMINDAFGAIFSGNGKGGGSVLSDFFAGFFDGGGMIPSGQFGIAGERGPEFIQGPARVTSRADTARMMGGGNVGGNATITIVAPEGFSAQQEGQIQGIAVRVTSQGLSSYDRSTLPGSVNRINSDPRRRG